MTYSKPMGMMYATAGMGLGPSGISPPFRKYGFRAFDGLGALGFDRLAENRTRTFVFSISSVRGLPSGSAGLVPTRLREYMSAAGLQSPDAGWAEGGRVWGRYLLPLGSSLISNASERRARLRGALERAAQSLGPQVSFEVSGLGRLPASAPASASVSSGGSPTPIRLDPVDVAGEVPKTTVSVRDLQTLLRSKGFNPGSVDGVWGRNTSGALMEAAQAARYGDGSRVRLSADQVIGSADRRSVRLPMAVFEAIQRLPGRPVASAPSRPAPARSESDIVPDLETDGVPLKRWLPWTAGAAVLLGVGGYYMWKGRKGGRRVAANRRRRRTSRRR